MPPKSLFFAIGLLACVLFPLLPFPFAAAEEATNSMASQMEEARIEKLTEIVERLERKMEEMEQKMEKMEQKMEQKEDVSLKIAAGKVDAKTEAVRLQLEVVNVYGSQMKFNAAANGLQIRDGGLDIEHHSGPVTVTANLPIQFKKNPSQAYIAFYFEVEILKAPPSFVGPIIGFCFDACSSNLNIGKWPQSIGMEGKRGVCYNINANRRCHQFPAVPSFETTANVGDVFGIGMLHSPGGNVTVIGTVNGKFRGSLRLPSSILGADLFPAISLRSRQTERMRANFGTKMWAFDILSLLEN